MNGSRFAEQARQLLQESLDQLNALKNANVRDTGFKQWRQNALTLIQRLCPGDSARSDRFRRVPFSPPSARADQRTTREWYERGCAEASQLMRSLLTEIEEHGVPQPMSPLPSAAHESDEMEGDFPTVDLPGGAPEPPPEEAAPPPPPPPPARSERRKHPRQESPRLEETLREVTGSEAAPRRPAPKPAKERGSVSRSVRERLKDMLGLGDMTRAPAREPQPEPEPQLDPMDHEYEPRVELPEPPPPPPPPPPARREPPAPARPARPAHREPTHREPTHREPTHREPAPRAATPPPRPREDAPPPRPRHEDPAPPRPKREEPPPPRRDMRARDVDDDEPVEMIEQPEFHYPSDEYVEDPATFDDEPVHDMRDEGEDEDPFAYDDELIAEVRQVEPESIEEAVEAIAEEEVDEAPLADQLPAWMRGQAAEPRRVTEQGAAREEDEASRRARARREERLDEGEVEPLPAPERPQRREAPAPRPEPPARPPAPAARPAAPVARQRPAERPAAPAPAGPRALTSPTAIALMAIASQVDELGVPEGHRARTRAALLELAREVEGRDMRWDVLREAVVFLVDYPPLARRVLPLLIPHLDQAA